MPLQVIAEAEFDQHTSRMRAQLQAGPNLAEFARTLDDSDLAACAS